MTYGRPLTDDMLRAAINADTYDRIQGFATPLDESRRKWGAPYYIRDVWRKPGEQELWRGDSEAEMLERCEMERMRIAINAAFAHGEETGPKNG